MVAIDREYEPVYIPPMPPDLPPRSDGGVVLDFVKAAEDRGREIRASITPSQKPIIVIDTREQRPFEFPGRETVTKALPVGDYSLVGFETEIAVERKSLDDFIGSLTRGRDRFMREMRALAAYQFGAVVVEAELRDLLSGHYTSRATAESMLASAMALVVNMGVHVQFCGDRVSARAWTEGFLDAAHRRILN